MTAHIIVIEEEPAVASVIRKALTEESYEVSVAMDGESAWDHKPGSTPAQMTT